MSSHTTEEAQALFLEVFGRECDEDQASSLVAKYDDFVEFMDGVNALRAERGEPPMNESPYVIPCDTFKVYLLNEKRQEDRDKADAEWRAKLNSMSGTERFLHSEGFANELGFKIQKFIDEADAGHELYREVLGIMFECDDLDLCQRVLRAMADQIGVDRTIVEAYLEENGDGIMKWFQGITCDGGRALRTIHICARNINKYCEEKTCS